MGVHSTRNGSAIAIHETRAYSLLLQIVLSGAARLAAREGALVVTLACVDPGVSSKVAAGSETAITGLTHMFSLGGR